MDLTRVRMNETSVGQLREIEKKLQKVEEENARLKEKRREDEERFEREKRELMEQQVALTCISLCYEAVLCVGAETVLADTTGCG